MLETERRRWSDKDDWLGKEAAKADAESGPKSRREPHRMKPLSANTFIRKRSKKGGK